MDGYLGLQSVRHGNSGACLLDIFTIHFPHVKWVADLTWGKGRFWNWPHVRDLPEPEFEFSSNLGIIGLDADTRGGAMIQSDYRWVPLQDQCVDVAVFDPPFIFSPGLRGIVGAKRFFLGSPEGNKERFYSGPHSDLRILAPRNAADLRRQTVAATVEMKRIARRGMVLKGQNLVTGPHPNWWTHQVMSDVHAMFEIWPEDMLIQVSPAARLADPRWKHQYHFRRAEAYYLIYKWNGGPDE